MTHLQLWNQPFPPIQTSARANKRLALQQVGSRKGTSPADLPLGLLPLVSGAGMGAGITCLPLPKDLRDIFCLQSKP